MAGSSRLEALVALSARIGHDPLKTQAAGGNTSLKEDGALWIKASGTWLAEAETRDIFLPVALAPLTAAVEANDPRAAKATDFIIPDENLLGLRPSVETSVHAVVPFAVVLHVHCIETVALAVRADAADVIAERLRPLGDVIHCHIPYLKPGLPLARAIQAAANPGTNVVTLGNHGLIVAADDVGAAGALLDRVSNALASPVRAAPPADTAFLAELADGSNWRLPADPVAHATATDPERLAIARQGSLYPDHVVFLGSAVAVLPEGGKPVEFVSDAAVPQMLLVVPGKGVLIHRDVLRGGDDLARALAEVTGRIAGNTPLRVLSADEERELFNWDAEIYRRALARTAPASPQP
ncbi:Rhamnose utilisation protein RhaD, predicted bifunctional aldolase and dehydrogenase [Kaistia soli DSM 19436]|uniref:Rhamnose utilisation protein RhaD, predicted bifunctional aldolase and dehydrogenase n=1 Tax=Kaistia soli DSM 19436 TaxID=1122133 RepID=A0A1M4Z5R7_9HYPH|nr:class II aldolase/adducin family protein [Kaistia soli]SHF13298.1 Rhamnose utilisation protein RhaD, predicted bifunctional aldolase and dehydrogenase [Kaistia soli DSM 19436]